MTVFAREHPSDVIEEIKPLLCLHWEEIAHYQDIPLEPDWDWYLRNPAVRVFTARKDGMMIGYVVYFVGPSRHYRSSIQGMQDILFVHPMYRGSTIGYRLIKFCDDQLRAEGVQVSYQHVKAAHDFSPLLLKQGYELIDNIYGKRLDRG